MLRYTSVAVALAVGCGEEPEPAPEAPSDRIVARMSCDLSGEAWAVGVAPEAVSDCFLLSRVGHPDAYQLRVLWSGENPAASDVVELNAVVTGPGIHELPGDDQRLDVTGTAPPGSPVELQMATSDGSGEACVLEVGPSSLFEAATWEIADLPLRLDCPHLVEPGAPALRCELDPGTFDLVVPCERQIL